MNKHKHHIIPKYHCKELGIDPDFDENIVEVDRLDHARIHWGYKCDDLEPLFEYITPEQWIIDLIPRGDNRDSGAAVITARGEIDGIDMSGENHPMWKGGIASKKIIFDRVYKEVKRFIVYHPDDMPLWDEDYVRELEHLRCVKETKRLISNGYEGRNRGEKLQAYCF
jgi:hypothetical protein